MHKYLTPLIVFVFVFGFSIPDARAVSFRLQPDTGSIYQNEAVTVSVMLDPETESINTFRGSVEFDQELFSLQSINPARSIVSSWIEPPSASGSSIQFSGFTSGEFFGVRSQGDSTKEAGELFSFTLTPQGNGLGAVSVNGAEAFSGQGKSVTVDGDYTSIQINPVQYVTPQQNTTSTDTGRQTNTATENDTTPPEPFMPRIIQPSPDCDSPLLVSFQTTDTGSGVDSYGLVVTNNQVGSTTEVSWQDTESPYELTEVESGQWVTVRSVDEAGNQRLGATMITRDDISNTRCEETEDSTQTSQKDSLLLLALTTVILLTVLVLYRRRKTRM